MKTPLTFLILVILALTVPQSQSRPRRDQCYETEYSGALLTLSWIGNFCSKKQCSPEWFSLWDGKSFTIHGYWPQSQQPGALGCLNTYGYDPYCFKEYEFQEQSLGDLTRELNHRWPQWGPKKDFWAYEWHKHGTCYLKLTLDNRNPEGWSEDQIYLRYWRQVLDKYESLTKLHELSQFEFQSKDQFADKIGLHPEQFFAVCKGEDLEEIRICYNLGVPGRQEIKRCGRAPKECKGRIVLKTKQDIANSDM